MRTDTMKIWVTREYGGKRRNFIPIETHIIDEIKTFLFAIIIKCQAENINN